MKKRGVGVAAGLYGTAAMGGGDPSTALLKLRLDGSADLFLGVTDIGQGCKTVIAQIAAEELGFAYEQIKVITGDTDTGVFCLGTMGSRVTYVAGNAAIEAAREVKQQLLTLAARVLKFDYERLVVADGHVRVEDQPDAAVPIATLAKMQPLIVGRGTFTPPVQKPNPDTGEWSPYNSLAFGAVLAEVEVDTQTGEVLLQRVVCTYDAGKAINPMMVEGQIEGGVAMSQGQVMLEVLQPNYPRVEDQPSALHGYLIPTAVDVPRMEYSIHECPSDEGPFGAKGIGELTAIVPPPAIASAINDAIGVWIHDLPITPEKILRALAGE